MNEFNIALSVLTFRKEAFNAMRRHRPMYLAFILPIVFGIGDILRKDPLYTFTMSSLEKLAFAVVISLSVMMVISLILQFVIILFGKQLVFWQIFNIVGLSCGPIALLAVVLWILNDFGKTLPETISWVLLRVGLLLYLYSFVVLLYGLIASKDSRVVLKEQEKENLFSLEEPKQGNPIPIPQDRIDQPVPMFFESPNSLNPPTAAPPKTTANNDNQDLVRLLKDNDLGGINVFYRPNTVTDFAKEHFPSKNDALKFAETKALEFDTIIVSDMP